MWCRRPERTLGYPSSFIHHVPVGSLVSSPSVTVRGGVVRSRPSVYLHVGRGVWGRVSPRSDLWDPLSRTRVRFRSDPVSGWTWIWARAVVQGEWS